MCNIGIEYQYFSRAVCAYAHVFWKQPGCAVIGACALIRMNMVYGNGSQTLCPKFQGHHSRLFVKYIGKYIVQLKK